MSLGSDTYEREFYVLYFWRVLFIFYLFIFVVVLVVLGIESRASYLLGKCSIPELYP